MQQRRQIEREFGVPFPGEILPPEVWTRTGLKHLPQDGPMRWSELFGRTAPLVIDLGCGNGRFLTGSAIWRPDHDHFGLDILPLVVRYATRRANQRGLANIRYAVGDAHQFVAELIEPGSIAELHVYHPQPYYEADQVNRRLLTPSFLKLVHGALEPSGKFFIQTDNPAYWQYLTKVLGALFVVRPHSGPWPDASKGRTRREIIALREGLPIYRAICEPRRDITAEAVDQAIAAMPEPSFNADRRLARLDEFPE